ncbi:YSIRK-type signal peptide-containing protein, partial [Staphylococcus hominis]|uniref:YSIRK-type signal peptide-containing protein n=2 Tax=Staphylococcus hominis TaxID=1290 RepID=UPI0006B98B11
MNHRDKLQKFSIRKYAVGTFSTLIATLVFLGTHTDEAHASQSSNATINHANHSEDTQPDYKIENNVNTTSKSDVELKSNNEERQNIEIDIINKDKETVLKDASLNTNDKKETEKRASSQDNHTDANENTTGHPKKIETEKNVDVTILNNELNHSSVSDKKPHTLSDVVTSQASSNKLEKAIPSEQAQSLEKLNRLTTEVQTLLPQAEQLEPKNYRIEEAHHLVVESHAVSQSTTITQQQLAELIKRIEQNRNGLANIITRAHSGRRDRRNGEHIATGSQFRFSVINSQWNSGTNAIVYQRNYASLKDGRALGTGQQVNGVEDITSKKTVLRGHIVQEGNTKYLYYDVFFNNDGVNMVPDGSQQRLGLVLGLPYQIMKLQDNGLFASDTVRNIYYTAYEKRKGMPGILSESPGSFIADPDNSAQPFNMLNSNQRDFGQTTFFLSFGIRPGNSMASDANEYFHANRNNPDLLRPINDQRGKFAGLNYGIGIEIAPNRYNAVRRAYHMHLEIKLRDGVTNSEIENAWAYANTGTKGPQSKEAYTVLAGRELPEDATLTPIVNRPPSKPVINSNLIGKATTTSAIDVSTDPNTKVAIFDKNNQKIGEGTTSSNGHANITPTRPIPEGNVTAKAYNPQEEDKVSTSDPKKATDTTPPTKPVINTVLTHKGGTQTVIDVSTDPNTHVDLLDKNNNTIGSGTTDNTGHVRITPTRPIPEGNVTAKATDNAEHPNSSVSNPVQATNFIHVIKPIINTDVAGKAFSRPRIDITSTSNTVVELIDKHGSVIGRGTTGSNGHAYIIPDNILFEGNITAKASDPNEPNNTATSDPRHVTDLTPPSKPVIHTNLVNKAGTKTPIDVSTDVMTRVEIIDENGKSYGLLITDMTGHAIITPKYPLPLGKIFARATDGAEIPNSIDSDHVPITDTIPPTVPIINTSLIGKATTITSITVITDPDTRVELVDKTGKMIGRGTTDSSGHVTITPTLPLLEGNIIAKAYDPSNNVSTSAPEKATDTTPPAKPRINTNLTGKATTKTSVDVSTDPNTHVDLLDKNGRVIGSGTTASNGHVIITPTQDIPEGNVTAKATDNAEHPNSSTSDPVKATDTTPPMAPTVTTDLTGKATTRTPISVTAEPHTRIEILDKDNRVIGSGTTDDSGHVTITPTQDIPEGNVMAKAYDNAEHPNSSVSQPKKATDTTPPAKPRINTNLTGKATTKTSVDVSTDPNTHVDLLDKNGRIIGSGTTASNGHVIITPTQDIPEGNVTAKATDNAEHPNSSTSNPVKATDTTPPMAPTVTTDLTGKATTRTSISVTAEPHTRIEILDKDNRVIGSGTTDDSGHVTITPTQDIP